MAADRADIRSDVTAALTPLVEAADLFLEDVRITGPTGRRTVRVSVDLLDGPGGVDSDHLTDLSRTVSEAMEDVGARIPGTYTLEVTTPGVDRELNSARHFRRAQGHLVAITTEDGEVTGRVVDADERAVVLRTEEGTRDVPLERVRSGRIILEMRPLDDHA